LRRDLAAQDRNLVQKRRNRSRSHPYFPSRIANPADRTRNSFFGSGLEATAFGFFVQRRDRVIEDRDGNLPDRNPPLQEPYLPVQHRVVGFLQPTFSLRIAFSDF